MLAKQSLKSEYKKEILKTLESVGINKNNSKIFLFGSRSSKTHTQRSDIDVGIESDVKGIYSKIQAAKEQLNEESSLVNIVDIVDFKTVTKFFKENANKHYW